MPYFHATWAENVPGILAAGLCPSRSGAHFDCEAGVYLADSPALALAFLLQAYAERGDPASSPAERMAAIVVFVVDDSRVDPRRLSPDPHFDHPTMRAWRHGGRVDVSGMPRLGAEEALAGCGGLNESFTTDAPSVPPA